jgi:hypothetical protein
VTSRQPHLTKRGKRLATLTAAVGLATMVIPMSIATAASGDPSKYAFEGRGQDGLPARWNPCQVVRYKVNLSGLRDTQGLADVQNAVSRLAGASGLQFRYDGTTTYVPQHGVFPTDTDIGIAFVKRTQSNELGTAGIDAVGEYAATSTDAYNAAGQSTYKMTNASVVLDAASPNPPGSTGNATYISRVQVLEHELGHAVGLDHVFNDDFEVMSPDGSGGNLVKNSNWGAGDLNGLKRVGTAYGCIYPDATHSDPTPGPNATPSPIASASPSASSSPSPMRSPTDTPTASVSPSPSGSPTTDQAPVVTLSHTVISAGQRTTVQYQGQPGTTLTILSKTQPATDYSVIGSVTLDGSGFGTSSHAPTKNTRIEARTDGGQYSGQPLIQVRSVASFNANRVGSRAYVFTGRVYPARNQRLVNVYRNGALVAQARCDASGIYRVTRTLAAGTYSFQARTASDTYNLGATSRSLQVSVH